MRLNRAALGTSTPTTRTRVEASRIAALCEVLGDSNPAFRNGWRGGAPLAPPTFINCFREHKSKLLIGALGVDMPLLLHGEQEMHYYAPIRAGDELDHAVTIVDIRSRNTRRMGPSEFFKVRIRLSDPSGAVRADAYQSFFVRDGG